MMTAINKTYMRYDDTELDEESLKIVREELKETEENKRKCLDILKKKLMDRDDLNPYLQENFLVAYLRIAKYDCSKAYHRILKYYDERRLLPDVFKDYTPRSVRIVEEARDICLSPFRTKENSTIVILKRKEYDPARVSYNLIIRALCMIGDVMLDHPVNQLCGFTFILDLRATWNAWSEYSPSRLKMLARLLQKSVAVKVINVHIVNASSIYYLLYSIVYPFLSTKIRNRIHIHKSLEDLHSYVEPEILPKEYGGKIDKSDLINIFDRLDEREDFLSKISKYGFIKKKK